MSEPFEYWVNVYEKFMDIGGSTREEADTVHEDLWAKECPRLACRLLRFTLGECLIDVTPPSHHSPSNPQRRAARTPEARERQAEAMREYWRKRKGAETHEQAPAPSPEREVQDTSDGSI